MAKKSASLRVATRPTTQHAPKNTTHHVARRETSNLDGRKHLKSRSRHRTSVVDTTCNQYFYVPARLPSAGSVPEDRRELKGAHCLFGSRPQQGGAPDINGSQKRHGLARGRHRKPTRNARLGDGVGGDGDRDPRPHAGFACNVGRSRLLRNETKAKTSREF